jgi:hypothetical protein
MRTLTILIIFLLFVSTAGARSPIEYFKGTWSITLKTAPASKIRWVVKDVLNGTWLNGEVSIDGNRTSEDRWGVVGGEIRRYAFLGSGEVVELRSRGWRGNTLVFTGTMTGGKGVSAIRETITKESPERFHALWERQSPNGRWEIFSEETCVKESK